MWKDKRCFGKYQCPSCRRQWMSGNSWAGYTQQCTKCKIDVLPFSQTPLEKSTDLNKSDPQKSHPQELCQKCRSLGSFCGNAY